MDELLREVDIPEGGILGALARGDMEAAMSRLAEMKAELEALGCEVRVSVGKGTMEETDD